MKTKLYHKFIKAVCSDFKISRQQLFSRHFRDMVFTGYMYDFDCHKLAANNSVLHILSRTCPLSQVWNAFDKSTTCLLKYWKHSRWKSYIQIQLDLGKDIESVVQDILKKKNKVHYK